MEVGKGSRWSGGLRCLLAWEAAEGGGWASAARVASGSDRDVSWTPGGNMCALRTGVLSCLGKSVRPPWLRHAYGARFGGPGWSKLVLGLRWPLGSAILPHQTLRVYSRSPLSKRHKINKVTSIFVKKKEKKKR
jgi:hypothetical protein